MTETDREYVANPGDVDENKRYQAISRVRDRFDELKADVETMEQHHPGLLREVRNIVCGDTDERIAQLESDLEESREEIMDLREDRERLEARLDEAPDPEEIGHVVEQVEAALERGDRGDVETALGRLREAAGVER